MKIVSATCAFALSLILACNTALARAPADTSPLTLGQSISLKAGNSRLGVQYHEGAKLYFDYINTKGGIGGRPIRLVTVDDGNDPAVSVANTEKLIDQEKPLALFGYMGTDPTFLSLPSATAARLPIFAPYTGTEPPRAPFHRYFFRVRASYRQEAEKIVDHNAVIGIKRVAVVYQNDDFGKEALISVQEALVKRKVQLAAAVSVESEARDLKEAVETVANSGAQAVIFLGRNPSCANLIRTAKSNGRRFTSFYTLSVIDGAELARELGADAAGLVIAQVMPSQMRTSYAASQDYHKLLKQTGKAAPTSAGFEGFIAARVMVEALRRAGANVSAESLIATLEDMRDFDAGGLRIGFTADNHTGSSFVELAILNEHGDLVY